MSDSFEFVNELLVKECYSMYRDHKDNGNWLLSGPSYDRLAETEKEFWTDFVKCILKKAKDANYLFKIAKKDTAN